MNHRKIRISGVGCALVDFVYTQANFDSPEFSKYSSKEDGDGGLSPGKLVFIDELESFAKKSYNEILLEINKGTYHKYNIGGPALVSLIHASQLLPEDKFEVSFYGSAGTDNISDFIFDLLKHIPLNVAHYLKISDKPSPFTHVISDSNFSSGEGERTFVNNIGAAWDFTPEMLTEDFFKSELVCFGGTALVPNIHDNLTYLLVKSKLNNSITIVNTVFDFRSEKINPTKPWPIGDSKESLKLIDVLIMDCEEALKISGKDNLHEAAVYFKEAGVSSFFITNGIKDVIIYSNGKLFNKYQISYFPVSDKIINELKANPKLKGDTTGCGDNFVGGIITSIANQYENTERGKFSIIDALTLGVVSGGFARFYIGGTFTETKKGEKKDKIKAYQTTYLAQISNDLICV